MKLKLTKLDKKAIDLIAMNGVVGVDLKGEPWLESNRQITKFRLRRLIELGKLVPNNDALFGESQTWRLAKPQ